MTRRLRQAFTAAEKLPETEQDHLAEWLLEEMRSEHEWERAFARSGDALARLANKALAEHRKGKTKELDPDAL
jgi:hypothetical protein